MSAQKINLKLPGYADLFSTEEGRADALKPKVEEIPLDKITEFPSHPFKVLQNDEMARMTESIRSFGVLVPALARSKEDGSFEVVSGHRRLAACRALHMETMPVIIREMTDDEAVITMVDANLQREHILPSEKAFAYKMKLEALKHQGKATSRQVVGKLESADFISSDNESGRQVQRYIRLTHLTPELLQQVDDGIIAFNPAVELSYLTEEEQQSLLDAITQLDCAPSHAQSIRLKKLSQDGMLSADKINELLSEPKPNQQEQYKFKRDEIRKYFPHSFSDKQVYDTVLKLLEQWQRKREREQDTR